MMIAAISPIRQRLPRLWNAALERFDGRIDVLVNNAGSSKAQPIDVD